MEPVRWLHVPKTGSSFINAVARYGCAELRPTNLSFGMPHEFTAWHAATSRQRRRRACERLEPPWAGHAPLAAAEAARHGLRVVAMFRRPAQRLLSGFYHADGVSAALQAKTMIAPGMPAGEREEMRRAVGGDAARYARWPGIASCATKMLIGRACASRYVPTDADVRSARWIVRRRLAVVGLVEHWASSICVFHRLLLSRVPIHHSELANTHAGPERVARARLNKTDYDEGLLRGFVDVHDEAVYATARDRLYEDMRRTGCGP
ncbi:hypothetical protein AB1Y20_013679 [Prymnesium parvum]|uniref:Sulfotransferase family protein n=1 Tax=Prymnesium parvum TaxID=97485 RepID=A0AB34IJS4_PRYPA